MPYKQRIKYPFPLALSNNFKFRSVDSAVSKQNSLLRPVQHLKGFAFPCVQPGNATQKSTVLQACPSYHYLPHQFLQDAPIMFLTKAYQKSEVFIAIIPKTQSNIKQSLCRFFSFLLLFLLLLMHLPEYRKYLYKLGFLQIKSPSLHSVLPHPNALAGELLIIKANAGFRML